MKIVNIILFKSRSTWSFFKNKKCSDCLPKLTIERAVKGMLSETETKRLMRRLNIYNDQNHPHQAQNPIEIDISNFYSNPNLSELIQVSKK
jgi:ribosomal protein L13